MRLLEVINPENVSEEEVSEYPVREAARAVVMDDEKRVALLHVAKFNYYKLPGGGVEASEDYQAALHRECHEEIGCEIEILGEIGSIVEYRKIFELKQVSYCYFAGLKGKKGESAFTTDEKDEGFEKLWVPYDEALKLLSQNDAANLEGRLYIVPRDEAFLKAASEYMI